MTGIITPVKIEERQKLGIRPGDTVRVHQQITETKKGKAANKKEVSTKNVRSQVFEGLVLAVKHGKEAGATFTVRTTMSGVGVERIFPLYAPFIEKIEVVKRSKVRRAKLYFIREKVAREVKRQLRNMRLMNVSTDDFAEKAEETVLDERPLDTGAAVEEVEAAVEEASEATPETVEEVVAEEAKEEEKAAA
jgi:large subunit ribosomal protein L19